MERDNSLTAQTFKYWEIFLSWLFKYPSRCYALEGENPCIYENASPSLESFGKTYRQKMASKGIICRVTPDEKDVIEGSNVLRAIFETIHAPELCVWASGEVMVKVMAYRNLKKGHLIPFPVRRTKGELELATYRVDEVFELWSKVKAFGLVRQDGHAGAPILLFRGTDFSIVSEGGRASIISDLDPKGPGWTLYEQGKERLREWLLAQERPGRVMGHSLGGILAAYTLICEADLMSTHLDECSFAFNFPGISNDLLENWIDLKKKPAFKGFICRGDVVSKFGYLFGDVSEISLDAPLSPIRAHEMLLFAHPRIYHHFVDLDLENHSPSRQFYSKLQEQTSSLIYEFGLKFLFP